MLSFGTILIYNRITFHQIPKERMSRMSEKVNSVELELDEENFSMKLNGVEVHCVKSFSIKCDAGDCADMVLNLDVERLKLG